MRRRHDAFQLVHDYEHMGLNNAYLSKMQHERALRYNDNHVNEHHHVAAAFTVLLKPHPPSPLSLFLSLSLSFSNSRPNLPCNHQVLLKPECNFLEALPPPLFATFRRVRTMKPLKHVHAVMRTLPYFCCHLNAAALRGPFSAACDRARHCH